MTPVVVRTARPTRNAPPPKPPRLTHPPDGFWERPELAAVLAARDVGAIFAALANAGLSQRRIALLVDMGQSEVSAIVRGRRVEKLRVLERLADGLLIPRERMRLGPGGPLDTLLAQAPAEAQARFAGWPDRRHDHAALLATDRWVVHVPVDVLTLDATTRIAAGMVRATPEGDVIAIPDVTVSPQSAPLHRFPALCGSKVDEHACLQPHGHRGDCAEEQR